MYKFSILTISYNQGQFLEKCILSVLNQNYPFLEYIIVDPGSTDGSREIIEKYRHHIDKIIFEPDQGPADGLNKGFSYATGDIYGFINSDDYYLPGTFQIIDDYFKLHPDMDVVSGHSNIVDEHDQILRRFYSDKFSLYMYAYGACVIAQPSTFFTRRAFQISGGFDIDDKSSWDGTLWVDMALNGMKFGRINRILSAYRLHHNSITGSKKLDREIKIHQQIIFKKIIKRERNIFDNLIKNICRLYKYIQQPRSFSERILYGPIYGRYKYE